MTKKQELQALLMNLIAGLNSVGCKEFNHISWELTDTMSELDIRHKVYQINEKLKDFV